MMSVIGKDNYHLNVLVHAECWEAHFEHLIWILWPYKCHAVGPGWPALSVLSTPGSNRTPEIWRLNSCPKRGWRSTSWDAAGRWEHCGLFWFNNEWDSKVFLVEVFMFVSVCAENRERSASDLQVQLDGNVRRDRTKEKLSDWRYWLSRQFSHCCSVEIATVLFQWLWFRKYFFH